MRISVLVLGLLIQQGRTVWDGGSYHCEPLGATCVMPSNKELNKHKAYMQPTWEIDTRKGHLTWDPTRFDCTAIPAEDNKSVVVSCKVKGE